MCELSCCKSENKKTARLRRDAYTEKNLHQRVIESVYI